MPSAEETNARLNRALTDIEKHAGANVERGLEIQRRVEWFHAQIESGRSIADVVADEQSPRVVELITINMSTLETVGSEFRAALALALRQDGLTVAAIGDLFGVTRQRISALLRQKAAIEAPQAPPPVD